MDFINLNIHVIILYYTFEKVTIGGNYIKDTEDLSVSSVTNPACESMITSIKT